MHERDLDRRLVDYYRVEVGGQAASPNLLASVTAIPDARTPPLLGGRTGVAIILAAALVLTLLLATVAAVGSWLRPDRLTYPKVELPKVPVAASLNGCRVIPLKEGDALAVGDSTGIAQRGTAESTITVSTDGHVLLSSGFGAGVDPAWFRRRLTPQGLTDLTNALVVPRLPSCRSYEYGAAEIWVTAGVGSVAYSISAGPGHAQETHVTTAEEARAVAAIHERLQDPDLGLPPADWTATAWTPSAPARWRVEIEVHAGPESAPLLDGSVTLPNGSPLRAIGDYASTTGLRAYQERCVVVGPDIAMAVIDAVRKTGAAQQTGYTWEFRNALVAVTGLISGEGDCSSIGDVIPGRATTPDSATPAGVATCSYLPDDAAVQALGVAGWYSSPMSPHDGWTECAYFVDSLRSSAGEYGQLYVSAQPVAAGDAPGLARDLFGTTGVEVAEFNGHAIFFNACVRGIEGDDCLSAVAISMEPDFVVVAWDGASQAQLTRLAETVAGRTPG